MSTPTPRTDAATFERRTTCATYRGIQTVVESVVTADFARTLERELARQHETSLMLLHEIWEREDGFTETRKRLSALETALTAERGKVRVLRSACESICEEWGRNHDAPFCAGSEMEKRATAALAATEDAT